MAANVPNENICGGNPETVGERLTRLTTELSEALDEVNAQTFAHDWGDCDTVGVWIARVFPSRINKHFFLEQMDLPLAYVTFCNGVVRS